MKPIARCLLLTGIGSVLSAATVRATLTQDEVELPAAGRGTLLQQDVAIRLTDDVVQLRVQPLDELILRLLAPDSYESLHALRGSMAHEVSEIADRYGTRTPSLFLVTVFGLVEQAEFDPEQLGIVSRNNLFRPIAILPLTPVWTQHRVAQRETAAAIYVFDGGIPMLEPFTVEYAGYQSDEWITTLPMLERERARIRGRGSVR